jgi:hypothetical protein
VLVATKSKSVVDACIDTGCAAAAHRSCRYLDAINDRALFELERVKKHAERSNSLASVRWVHILRTCIARMISCWHPGQMLA